MSRRTAVRGVIGSALVALVVVALSGSAGAKGAQDATLTGPGITGKIHIGNDHDGAATPNPNQLAEVTGTFYAAFRTTPSPIEASRPTGPLGPRYRIVYRLYTGEKEVTPVRQDVYPFARAGFVTFTPAGQRVFDKQVVSGWYTSPASATELFVAAGVPDRRS